MDLESKIRSKEASVAIIGMGYVGLTLSVALAKKGICVRGIDNDHEKIHALRAGRSHVPYIESKDLESYQNAGLINLATTEEQDVYKKVDVVCIAVPTPVTSSFDPDLSCLLAAAEHLAPYVAGKLVILESSSYPGTTEELLLPLLARAGGRVGKDFYLGYSPERVDPGNKRYGLFNTPRLVAGVTTDCRRLALLFYSHLGTPLMAMSSPKAAEMAKLLENTFRAVNIAFINELGRFCRHMNLNISEVIAGARTKPFGFMPFYPGPGAGGHCIPVDPLYLLWKAKQMRFPLRFVNLAWEVNTTQPEYVVERLREELGREGINLKGAQILVLGVAYKEDIGDVRESPALVIMDLLQLAGAQPAYSDPHIPELAIGERTWRSLPLGEEVLKRFDCIVLHTPHRGFDYKLLLSCSRLIFDCRNYFHGEKRERPVVAL